MTSEFTLTLLRASLFAGIAIVLVLLIRKPLRRWCGAVTAYQAWLVVPCATVAAILPGRPVPVLDAAPALRPLGMLASQAVPQGSSQLDALLLTWAAGTLVCAAWFIVAHRAFLRSAGRLTRSGDLYVSEGGAGPASIGLLRPKIIVPHDFRQSYSAREQVLVIAHERTHIARGDAHVNLLAAAFQCIFWFNPLCHLGVRCFRQDQEIACDALVMGRHPRQRRTYAEALFKSHVGAAAARPGIHCYWQSHHPTKERLMSLQLSPSGKVRRIAGRSIVGLFAAAAVAGTLSARAEQASAAPAYSVQMTLEADGVQATPRVVTRAGEKFAVASGAWRIEMSLREGQAPGSVWVTGLISKASEVVSTPTLLTRVDEKATIKVGDSDKPFALSMVVSPQP